MQRLVMERGCTEEAVRWIGMSGLSYQPLCLCIQSVVAPTTSAAVAVSLMENTVFPLGLKIVPSRASLPSALLDNR